ncbi:hypothetical protein KFE25_012763 [Diacronema lutheri]|uniref:Serine/threonine-protein phosphatase n=3 Tax=Diacronema lutheri TaxID=2081491 RepID=A0A8J5X320_DIALT|nr:hypothetical protein KFE25_012763 [Diacronema lutheri]
MPSKPADRLGDETPERTERTYGAWSQAEENDEQDFLEAHKTAVTVQNKLQALHPEKFEAHEARKRSAASRVGGRNRPPPPERYTGPHLTAPWTLEQADALLDFFVQQPSTGADLPHVSYMEEVLAEGIELFKAMPSVMKIPVPTPDSGATLIVVGDTHGQLADVLYIFSVHGPPSPVNVYLFNGDIADRGPMACEIVLLLLTYKLAVPDSIFINRGNHENSDINERPAKNGGGFAAEVRSKYDRETFHLFQTFFCALPLATVLGDECVVVHGGLCRLNPTVEQMRAVSREMQCPDMPLTLDETILFDSLWADPAADGEPAGSGRGGVCYSFDEVATSKFLTLNGLSLVIRSHQLPPKQRGYMLHHSNKVLTIFSASNYCGVCANHGSILILRGGMSEVWEYRAPPMDVLLAMWGESKDARDKERAKRVLALKKKSATLGMADIALAQIRTTRWGGHTKERRVSIGSLYGRGAARSLILSDLVPDESKRGAVAGMEVSIVRALKERICLHRADLLRLFHRADKSGSGLLSLGEWQGIVERALGVPVDWGLHASQLVKIEAPSRADGRKDAVDFVRSLERYQIRLHEGYAGWQANVLSRVYSKLLESDLSIESLKARFDANRDGHVTAREVLDVLLSFDLALATPQLERALLWMNMSEGSRFEASTFISQLYVMCHDGASARSPPDGPNRIAAAADSAGAGDATARPSGESERGVRAAISGGSAKGAGSAGGAAHGASSSASDTAEYSMVHLSDGSRMDGVEYVSTLLTHLVDTDKDGELSQAELTAVSQHLWAMIDTDRDGYLSYDEFANAIMRLLQDDALKGIAPLQLRATSLSREHALHLARRIDVCNTGHICFLEFLPLFISINRREGTALHGSNSALIQHICTHIYQQQHALTKAFQFFDKDEDGMIEPSDFVLAVAMVGEVISKGQKAAEPFTHEQIEILARHCPKAESGQINYNAFLSAFVVVDMANHP